jgi:hypothetical protein
VSLEQAVEGEQAARRVPRPVERERAEQLGALRVRRPSPARRPGALELAERARVDQEARQPDRREAGVVALGFRDRERPLQQVAGDLRAAGVPGELGEVTSSCA